MWYTKKSFTSYDEFSDIHFICYKKNYYTNALENYTGFSIDWLVFTKLVLSCLSVIFKPTYNFGMSYT